MSDDSRNSIWGHKKRPGLQVGQLEDQLQAEPWPMVSPDHSFPKAPFLLHPSDSSLHSPGCCSHSERVIGPSLMPVFPLYALDFTHE